MISLLEDGGTSRGAFRYQARVHLTNTRAHQRKGSTRRNAQRRRRTNLHRARVRLDASSCQPRASTTSWSPRARQCATPSASGTGAPVSACWTWHPRRSGPSGRKRTPDGRYSRVKHADLGMMRILSRPRNRRGRRAWWQRGRTKPSLIQLCRF